LGAIRLGQGSPEGEAYLALQEYILALKAKGVILAVCSKNNEADAREPFLKHPEMRVKLDDIAAFIANWEPKPDNLRRIAKLLNIGLDSLVFLDDNPVEREIVRQMLPEIEVVALPADPSGYRQALAAFPMFETSSFTAEDAQRSQQYRARAQIAELEASATSIEEFYRSLQMQAEVAPFNELNLQRIVQLIGKTNQFNMTTRRHGMAQVRAFMDDASCVHFSFKLRDRFTDHGLVAIMIAQKRGDVLDIDTWLMSCRVIGRTVEAEMLSQLCLAAAKLSCTELRGTFIPTAKNDMAKDVFASFGFERCGAGADGSVVWRYDLAARGRIRNEFIAVVDSFEEAAVDAA
jgi:FkbH-like protein